MASIVWNSARAVGHKVDPKEFKDFIPVWTTEEAGTEDQPKQGLRSKLLTAFGFGGKGAPRG